MIRWPGWFIIHLHQISHKCIPKLSMILTYTRVWWTLVNDQVARVIIINFHQISHHCMPTINMILTCTKVWWTVAAGANFLRNEDDFQVPFARTNHLQRFPLIQIPTLWNTLPQEIKTIRNTFTFINSVKKMLLSNLPDTPVFTRLFCPVCSL
jgi:hypothetical protein